MRHPHTYSCLDKLQVENKMLQHVSLKCPVTKFAETFSPNVCSVIFHYLILLHTLS